MSKSAHLNLKMCKNMSEPAVICNELILIIFEAVTKNLSSNVEATMENPIS